MSHLSTLQLANLAGITKRQTQRILERGTPDLGAHRTDGGHWAIPDTPAVRKWARGHHRWRRGGLPKADVNPPVYGGVVTIEGVSAQFSLWAMRMEPWFDQWDADQLDRAIGLLSQQARIHAELVAMRDGLERRK